MVRSRARAKNPIQPGDGDPRHGTANGYDWHGCDCEKCKTAWANLARDRRQAPSAATVT